jgi:hypothetical protein
MSVLLTKTGESFFVILSCLKSTESVYQKFLSLIRTVPVYTVAKDFLLKSAEFENNGTVITGFGLAHR